MKIDYVLLYLVLFSNPLVMFSRITANTKHKAVYKTLLFVMLITCACICFESVAQTREVLLSKETPAKLTDLRLDKKFQDAEMLLKQWIQQSENVDEQMLLIEWHYEGGMLKFDQDKHQEAAELFHKALKLLADEKNQIELKIKTLRLLGLSYRHQSMYAAALEFLEQAMVLAEEYGDLLLKDHVLNSKGVVYNRLGQFENALAAHNRSLQINIKINDQDGIASALHNIGKNKASMGEHMEAVSFFRRALDIDRQLGDDKNIAYSANNLAISLLETNQIAEAKPLAKEAVSLFEKTGALQNTQWSKLTIAKIKLKESQPVEALNMVKSALTEIKQGGFRPLFGSAYETMTQAYLSLGEIQKAREYANTGLKHVLEFGQSDEPAKFFGLLSDIYAMQDEFESALLYKQKQLDWHVQHFSEKKALNIAQIQSSNDFLLNEEKIKRLQLEKEQQQKLKDLAIFERNIYLFSGVGVCIIFALLYGWRIQRRFNHRLVVQVKQRTAELEQKRDELQRANRELELLSHTDNLTGVNNRHFLEAQINKDLDASYRAYQDFWVQKTSSIVDEDVVVFLIDVDYFKKVNDRYGHLIGDEVLSQIAQRITDVFRQSDLVVRWGGEEFIAVARFINRDKAPQIAQRILDEVGQTPIKIDDVTSVTMSCSIGYVCYPPLLNSEHNISWSTLLGLADTCLYACKRSGRAMWIGVQSTGMRDGEEISGVQMTRLIDEKRMVLKTSHHDLSNINWQG